MQDLLKLATGVSTYKSKKGQELKDALEGSNKNFLIKYKPTTVRKLLEAGIDYVPCRFCGADISERPWGKEQPKYCGMKCYKQDDSVNQIISKIKSDQYSNPERKAEIEAKKIATNRHKLGVDHPMQNTESFEKQKKSSFEYKEHNGVLMQGYEPQVFDFLSMFDGLTIQRGVDKQETIYRIDENGSKRRTYPDFWIPELNSYVEVKSIYTRKVGNSKILGTAATLKDMGLGYIVVVFNPSRKAIKGSILIEYFNQQYILDHE